MGAEGSLSGDPVIELANLPGDPGVTINPGISCKDGVFLRSDSLSGFGPARVQPVGFRLAVAFPGLFGGDESPSDDGGFSGRP